MIDQTTNNHTPTPTSASKPGPRSGLNSLSDRVRSLRLSERPVARTSSAVSWLPWVLCVLFAVLTFVLGMRALNRPRLEEGAPAAAVATPAGAAGSGPTASSGDVVLESKGNITPVHQIQVSPKVSGMVVKLDILEGKYVEKGQFLAQLETVDYEADRDHAVGALDEARQNLRELTEYRAQEIDQSKARWEEAEAQRKQLGLDRDRSVRLRGSALAERDWEQADSAYLAMAQREKGLRYDYELLIHGPRDNRIAAAEHRVRQAQADLDKAQWRLDNCTIKAPISGTILTKKAEEGNIVNPIAFNISASLCDMADLSDLEVDLNIQERDVAKVFKNQPCKIRPEAFPDRVYEGYVSRLMPIADRAKGAVPVRVKVQVPRGEEGNYLKPEMGVIVSFFKKPGS